MSQDAQPKPIDWEYLLDKIRDKECLLILGSEVFANESGETLQSRLLSTLDLEKNPYIRRHYPGEDFFLFDHKSHRTQFCHQIKKFYRSERPGELIKLLVDIPFHIYMTLTPDLLLTEAFKEKDYQFQHGYYKKNTDPQPIRIPTSEQPLIYNLLGCIENEESLVLSHDDLYDYFKSIFARRSMPGELKDELREIRNLLFIGVPFDKWHLQILLRELEIHNQQYAFTQFAANQNLNMEVCTLCFEQFQIQFVDKKVEDFVRELHHRVAIDPNISFRKSSGPKTDLPALLRSLIAEGDTETALDHLTDYLTGSDLQDEIDKINGRFGRFKKRSNGGVISTSEIMVEENRINSEILDLIKKIAAKS